ncbi:MAG: fluoride exporter [Frankiaceae bacterium]|nr:fluoride exporter [Frankiaceae bacterium]MDQ1726492.1 fluoride exporter [Frankiaceae bacterium]
MALAGACGAVARFVVDGAVTSRRTTTFPWATFGINVTGSFVLGLLAGAFAEGSWWRLVVGVGFCGGYTTFSTASMETVRLVQRGRLGAALAFGLGGLVASVAAAAAGWWLTA